MKLPQQDTIAAIATPVGEGALSIVRISGPRALAIADTRFRGRHPLTDVPGFTVHAGTVQDVSGLAIDEVLATVFRSPRSYTGEDAVEFTCHGGLLVTERVLRSVLEAGARQANPGEFTRRAFLNGRIDLSQAEAVADVIAARSEKALRLSLDQLEGKLSVRVREIKLQLMELSSLLELELDFSEEGLDLVAREDVERRLVQVRQTLLDAAATFTLGRIAREGILVAIVGRPNAGKSSLFNALLREARAIVTHLPGTTRDALEENISLSGLLFRLTDTAGIREAGDIAEAEGISRSLSRIASSDIVLVVEDNPGRVSRDKLLSEFPGLRPDQKLLLAYSKSDLRDSPPGGPQWFNHGESVGVELDVSALTGSGLNLLEAALVELARHGSVPAEGGVAITNQRHWQALERGAKSLASALQSLRSGASNEFIAFDVRESVEALEEITGEITTEEVLNHIFSRFCIGK